LGYSITNNLKIIIIMEFKIEKNIEITPALRGKSDGRPRPSIYPFEKMSVGDSFIAFEYSRRNMTKISTAARNWNRRRGLDWKFETRKTSDNMVRIWRTK
jgi:hypothetical protein